MGKGPEIGEVNEIISFTFIFTLIHIKYQNKNSLDLDENSLS